jgi:hypothetical protein
MKHAEVNTSGGLPFQFLFLSLTLVRLCYAVSLSLLKHGRGEEIVQGSGGKA